VQRVSLSVKAMARAILVAAILVASLGVVVAVSVRPAGAATTGGYPYASAPCADTTNTRKGVHYCLGDNWSGPAGLYDPTYGGYGYRNCTDWVAFRLATNNGYTMPTAIGDASAWGSYFTNQGIAPNNTPAVGAIAWESGGNHVAYVEKVLSGGMVRISEYNEHYYPGVPTEGNGTYDERTVPDSTFDYIHVKDLPSGPPTVSSFTATPSTLSAAGATVTLSANVNNATSCQLTSKPTILDLPPPSPCSTNPITWQVSLPANSGKKFMTYKVTLTATGTTTATVKTELTVEPKVPSGALTGVQSVTSDGYGYCALLSSGGIDCWGYGLDGQLGNGADSDSAVPVSVEGISDAQSVVSDDAGYCALLATGAVDCWGSNDYDQLGDGTSGDSDIPEFVLSNVTTLDSNDLGYCAVLGTGGVDCWGYNDAGELGNGYETGPDYCTNGESCSSTPLPVVGVSEAMSLATDYDGYCALLSSGGADCWGWNEIGELGNGTSTYESDVAVPVSGLDNASDITSDGSGSYCALLTTGGIECWGSSEFGELGNGSTTGPDDCSGDPCSWVPDPVANVSNAIALTGSGDGGNDDYCALLTSSLIDCWGSNADDALGDGSNTQSESDTPLAVSGINGVTSISLSNAVPYACASLSSGVADCWGSTEYGELGDGKTSGPDCGGTCFDRPQAVKGIGAVEEIDSDGDGNCALMVSGNVACWGYGYDGELGNGKFYQTGNNSSDVPVNVDLPD
jgi:surface antigen/alpha-tubulin suppressor-like RCC1 family protein